MKKKLMFIIIICGFITLAGAIRTQVVISSTVEEKSTRRNLISAYTPHEPIEITNDGNFTDYGFPGTGEETDPFIIEGFNITTDAYIGIHITDTTKYFIIRDCFVDANNGIFIDNEAVGTPSIINNTCTNNNYGIRLDNSPGAILANNSCTNNANGIYLLHSSDSILSNNTCTNNGYGIFLHYSSCTLANNTCTNNSYYGIYLWHCSGAILTNNSCYNDGFYFSENTIGDYLNYVIENNWVNEKPLGFFINLEKTILSESLYGQLILVNCTGMEVCNQELSNTSIGLYLLWCENAILTNNTCTNNYYGISLRDSPGTILINNTCTTNNYHGIYLYYSSGAILTDNNCTTNNYGIYLWHSSGANLTNNICSTNNIFGIFLDAADTCLITYNLLYENEEYGICADNYCENNIIHHNTFVNNNLAGASQAYDDGENIWYDDSTNEGNYWSDWSGIGSYPIDGVAGSVDPYPLDEEGNPPAVAEFTQISTVTIVLFFCIIIITCFFKKKRKII